MRNRNVVVSTTSTLEGHRIKAYRGVVSSHVVAGTGLFSDVFASLSDIFGGRSQSYRKQLAAINNAAIDELRQKAVDMGANAIVGLSIDHDEISGGGKSMFMVTVTGTAVIAEAIAEMKEYTNDQISSLSAEELEHLLERQRIITDAEAGNLKLDEKTWNFIIEHQVHEVAPTILATIGKVLIQAPQSQPDFFKQSRSYFYNMPQNHAKSYLYGALEKHGTHLHKLVIDWLKEMNLFDYDRIVQLLRSDNFDVSKQALNLALIDKHVYEARDVGMLLNLRSEIEGAFPEKAKEVEVSRTFSSSTKEMWICECGVKNELGVATCSRCGRDKYGFNLNDTKPPKVISTLTQKIEILKMQFEERAFSEDSI